MNRAFWINAALFQLLWLGAVVGAGSYGFTVLACLSLIPVLAYSLSSEWRWHDLLAAFAALAVGVALDTLWVRTGILDFGTQALAPYWICLLWIGVGLTLNHSLEPLASRPLVGAIAAGAFAPVSYYGGSKVGAVEIPELVNLLWISPAWFVAFYALFTLSRWMRVLQPDVRLGNLP